jgi:hypothetical protein
MARPSPCDANAYQSARGWSIFPNCTTLTPGSSGIEFEEVDMVSITPLLKIIFTSSARMISPSKSVAFRSKIVSF